ncbi:hypothetical protein FN846DRAFT_1005897 [Sphaerosporella brunnea]|uniref:Uncharacterized protein n=1 Tax=Sphaerosporella brunnea TaxID=1250544 RepID=A0A5J5EDD7_9PEZI|nr:hypothetical protein FN846DRAFT_1005897 [Sphaerosporella brunnea]
MAPPAFPRPEQAPRYGPKMVPVAEKHRKIRRDAPVKRTRCRPTNRKKIEILNYLDTPREFTMGDGLIETRKPTSREAGKFYGVNASQLGMQTYDQICLAGMFVRPMLRNPPRLQDSCIPRFNELLGAAAQYTISQCIARNDWSTVASPPRKYALSFSAQTMDTEKWKSEDFGVCVEVESSGCTTMPAPILFIIPSSVTRILSNWPEKYGATSHARNAH